MRSPVGKWNFTQGHKTPIGQADITINYPEDDYQMCFINSTDRSIRYSSVPPSELNKKRDVFSLDENNKFSIYSAVIGEDGGFYNWLFDQDF